MTWVRCYGGDLVNLETGLTITQYAEDPGTLWHVVVKRGSETLALIYPSFTRDECRRVMDALASRLIGYGETALDFRPECWPRRPQPPTPNA